MVRSTAREIAVRLSYELSFTDLKAEALLDQTLTPDYFLEIWSRKMCCMPNFPAKKQSAYIRKLVCGVAEHGAELDSYIEKVRSGLEV